MLKRARVDSNNKNNKNLLCNHIISERKARVVFDPTTARILPTIFVVLVKGTTLITRAVYGYMNKLKMVDEMPDLACVN